MVKQMDIMFENLILYHGSNVKVIDPKIIKGRFNITQFIQGIINREQFWVMIKFNYPTHQVCFCTEKALKNLKYIGCDYYDE